MSLNKYTVKPAMVHPCSGVLVSDKNIELNIPLPKYEYVNES